MANELAMNGEPLAMEVLNKLLLTGDLKGLSPEQQIQFYDYRCRQAGVDPATKPFDLITLNGKMTLYATAGMTQQLSAKHSLSTQIVKVEDYEGIHQVTCRVSGPSGRFVENVGAVTTKGLSGDALCNARMKATTKAKRRTILDYCGLGCLDESELETIPGLRAKDANGEPAKPIAQPQRKSETMGNVTTSAVGQTVAGASTSPGSPPQKLSPQSQSDNMDIPPCRLNMADYNEQIADNADADVDYVPTSEAGEIFDNIETAPPGTRREPKPKPEKAEVATGAGRQYAGSEEPMLCTVTGGDVKEGTAKATGKPWKKYILQTSEGVVESWDDKVYAFAAKMKGKRVKIFYEVKASKNPKYPDTKEAVQICEA